MRFFQNVPSNLLVDTLGGVTALSTVPSAKRRDKTRVELAPFEGSPYAPTAVALPASFSLVFVLKPEGRPGANALALAISFTLANGVYGGVVDLNTVELCQAFIGAANVNSQSGTAYTPALTDKGLLVTIGNTADQVFTLPKDTTRAFAVGDSFWLMAGRVPNNSTATPGIVTIAPEDNTVTIVHTGLSLTIDGGVPVLCTKSAANTWALSIPDEEESITCDAEWSWWDTTQNPIQSQSTVTFAFQVNNDVYRGNEGLPTSTADASNYPTNAVLAAALLLKADVTALTAEATARASADAGEAAARTSAIAAEATARNTAISVEAGSRATADALLQPKLLSIQALDANPARTLVLSDAYSVIRFAYIGPVTVTIPLHATVALPVGCTVRLLRTGLGGFSLVGATGGVTIQGLNGILAQAINDSGVDVELIQVAQDAWWARIVRPPSPYEAERAVRQQTLADAASSSGTVAWDMASGTNAKLVMVTTGARVIGAPSNLPPAGAEGKLLIVQASSGTARTVTFNTIFAAIDGAIVLNTGAGSRTLVNWYYDGTNLLITKA